MKRRRFRDLKKIPAQRIAFINKDLPAIIESNSCGFASFKAPPSGSISSAMSLRASHDSVAKGAVELSINRSGSKIVPIQLESATIPDVMIAIERVRPGKGLNQRDAIRYLGLENQARLGNLLLKSLNLPEMNIEAELSSENTNALPHSNRKKSPALKLKLRIYIGVPDRNLVLIGDLQDDSGRIIATTQSSLGDTEIHQNAAIEAISHSVVSFISSGGQHPTMVTPHSISGRWITIEAEPKPTEIAWANGTTHLPFTDAPIDIGNSTQVAIVPPPGYLGVEINLTNARSWIDFSGPNKISLHRDFITNALELAKQGAFEEAIKSLEGVPKSHPQFFDSLVLIAIIEGHQQSKNHATLEAILKHSSESLDSPKTSLSNEQTTNVVIAVNQLIEAQEANAKRRLELAEISIQLVEKILPKLRNENRNDLVKVVLAYQGLAKGIMAGANGDPVLAAESEAALKEVLKLSEGEPISHRSHALKVIATKSLRALDRH
ncbi:MAG: hypothetical protein NTV34_15610 [Proteobacteria bacterium]|nr:hypothetical protein [Pseudomonadota bacterium]